MSVWPVIWIKMKNSILGKLNGKSMVNPNHWRLTPSFRTSKVKITTFKNNSTSFVIQTIN
jgi:hypothetical protein